MSAATQTRVTIAAVTAVLGLGCAGQSSDPGDATRSSVEQAIIAGRPSGADENFAVFLTITRGPGDVGHCSGTLVAPRLVVTASHCLTTSSDTALSCTADGDTKDPRTEPLVPPGSVRVSFGAEKSSLVEATGEALLTTNELSACRNDIAVVVLAHELADVRMPIRATAVRMGERVSLSGWGYTADGQSRLPDARSTRDEIEVTDVGPGLIPAGSFAVPGATVCMGDSGAGARIDGALAGVFSRIAGGPYTMCEMTQASNIFSMTAPNRSLFDRAFAQVGEKAWYAGSPPPWLAEPGARCEKDADCQLGACDPEALVCQSPCGDAGATCRADERCDGATARCVPATADAGSTAAGPPTEAPSSACLLASRGPAPGDGARVIGLGAVVLGFIRRFGRGRSGRGDATRRACRSSKGVRS